MSRRHDSYRGSRMVSVPEFFSFGRSPEDQLDPAFVRYCVATACAAVPPRRVLADRLSRIGFRAPGGGRWTEDDAEGMFVRAIGLHLGRLGMTRRDRAPRIIGLDARGKPYAWSINEWKRLG